MNAKPKKKKPKPKIVPKFQIAEYQIAPIIDPIETELNRRLKEAKQFIEHLSSLEVKGQVIDETLQAVIDGKAGIQGVKIGNVRIWKCYIKSRRCKLCLNS